MEEMQIIAGAKKGGRSCFEDIVRLYYKRVYGLALLSARSREDANDIVQEVFIRLHRYIKQFDESRPFASWLYVIEKNVVRRFYHKKQPEAISFDNELEEFVPAAGIELQPCDRILLFEALDRLEEDDRNLIYARFFQGLAVKELAEMFDETESNIKVKLFRTKEKLKEWIEGTSDEKQERSFQKSFEGRKSLV